jgi:hypothetical protein
MIVPVSRWATATMAGLTKPVQKPRAEKPKRKKESLFATFEKLMSANIDVVLRNLDD